MENLSPEPSAKPSDFQKEIQKEDGIPLLKIVFKYLILCIRKWYFFAFFVAIFSTYSFFKIRYLEPLYRTSATLKFFVDNNNEVSIPGISEARRKVNTINIQTELATLQS